jgi:hypothetical protein
VIPVTPHFVAVPRPRQGAPKRGARCAAPAILRNLAGLGDALHAAEGALSQEAPRLQWEGRLGFVPKEDRTVKHPSWQSMALGGALAVAFSAAIPGSQRASVSCPVVPYAAGFEVEVRDDGIVEAVFSMDPDLEVGDVSIWSGDVAFGDPVEVEPGIWVAEAPAHLEGGCYTATVEVVFGGAASAPPTKIKKSKSAKKPHASQPASKSKPPSKSKKKRGGQGAPLVLTLTATGCNGCAAGDDPFTPLPGRS